MSRTGSAYYPPRALWYSPLLYMRGAIVRRLALDRIYLPAGVRLGGMVLSFLIPGFAFYLRAPRVLGRGALAASAVLLFVFFAQLGRPASNIAFGLLLALHVSGLGSLFDPWLSNPGFRSRLVFSMALYGVMGLIVYLPAMNYLDRRWCAPLQIGNRTVVIRKYASVPRLQRGDQLAYKFSGSGDHTANVAAGLGLGPVLAVAGDSVHFTAGTFEVNGVSSPRLAHMPQSGELVVPEKHWLVWPDFYMGGHGGVDEKTISDLTLQVAVIGEPQFLGTPFRRWFWHNQAAP